MMLVSAIMFLIVVVALRLMGGVFEDSMLGIINLAFGEKAEDVPLIDWSSLSWMDPSEWSGEGFKEAINEWVHKMIDSILPAMVYLFHVSIVHAVIYVRMKVAGAVFTIGKWVAIP